MRDGRTVSWVMLVGLVVVAGFGCGGEGRREIEEKVVTSIEHIPPERIINGGDATIRVNVQSTAPPEQHAVILYYRIGPEWTGIPMQSAGEGVYEAEIPRQPKGTLVGYYIDVRTAAGTRVTLPGDAPEDLYFLRFQGKAPDWVQVSRNVVLYAALAVSFLAGVLAVFVLRGRAGVASRIPFLVSIAALCYFLGGILLQMTNSWYVDGRLWSGFPVGSNPADTKLLVVVVFWALVAGITRTRVFRSREEATLTRGAQLAVLVLVGFVLTVFLFLLPNTPELA